jgi:outer membrane usher protein
VEKSADRTTGIVGYQRSMASDGGWGWNLAHTTGGSRSQQQASLQYGNTHFVAQGGLYGDSRQRSQWGRLTGSLGTLGGYVFAANAIHDGFALVSTQGVSGVPVSYDNQRMGVTNSEGFLLVPRVPAYYRGRYAIDPLALPLNVHVPEIEREASVGRGKGMLVRLPVQALQSATIHLVDPSGEPLAMGSQVDRGAGHPPTVVGWDGVVYLPSLAPHNALTVTTPQGDTCGAHFLASEQPEGSEIKVICLEQAPLSSRSLEAAP